MEFSPYIYIYIRSSPRGPNRDPNRTLSNELLLSVSPGGVLQLQYEVTGSLIHSCLLLSYMERWNLRGS